MAADFNTEILMKGTKEELLAMAMVLIKYATEMHEQYIKEHNCAYLESVYINGRNSVSEITDDQLNEIIENSNGTINVEAMGPYGVFGLLEDVRLFEDLADSSPDAYFEGLIEGFSAGGDESCKGILKDKKLYLYEKYPEDEWDDLDEDEDWDEEDDTFEEDDEWDDETIYDPITKKYSHED